MLIVVFVLLVLLKVAEFTTIGWFWVFMPLWIVPIMTGIVAAGIWILDAVLGCWERITGRRM